MRRGVDALEADRARCCDCGRTPLIGEHIHLYGSPEPHVAGEPHGSPEPHGVGRLHGARVLHGLGELQVVCELCRMLRREAPAATEVVRHSERGLAVRVTARVA
jgi:hypothetical protein